MFKRDRYIVTKQRLTNIAAWLGLILIILVLLILLAIPAWYAYLQSRSTPPAPSGSGYVGHPTTLIPYDALTRAQHDELAAFWSDYNDYSST